MIARGNIVLIVCCNRNCNLIGETYCTGSVINTFSCILKYKGFIYITLKPVYLLLVDNWFLKIYLLK
jgi:hypothetical protein